MKLSADCSFHIGVQHLRSGLPCQDYAVAGIFDSGNHAYAIVSDGCSSGGRTDVGARIIALGAERMVRIGPEAFSDDDMTSVWRGLGLGVSDLLATSVMAQKRTNEDAVVRISGDGVAAFVDEHGGVRMTKAEWAGNMPWYAAYAMDASSYDNFMLAHEPNGGNAFRAETWTVAPDGSMLLDELKTLSARSVSPIDGYLVRTPRDLRAIAVFSDGVTQVEGETWQNVVLSLLAFRSTAGDFVKRRMNRFLRDVEKVGRGPIDDISMACILVEP